jgi:hypothetical protein
MVIKMQQHFEELARLGGCAPSNLRFVNYSKRLIVVGVGLCYAAKCVGFQAGRAP